MKRSRPEEVFAGLKREILTGTLPPGTKLPFAALCDRYRVSVGVAREALQRLVEQGLVVGEPGHGFRVVDTTPDELWDLTEARCVVESTVLERAVAHGDLAWESRLVAAHHTLDNTPVLGDNGLTNPAWADAHAGFHHAMLSACPNRRLVAIASSLRDSAEVYRQWAIPLGESSRYRGAAEEHAKMLAALLARESTVAVELLVDHIRHTTRLLMTEGSTVDGSTVNGSTVAESV